MTKNQLKQCEFMINGTIRCPEEAEAVYSGKNYCYMHFRQARRLRSMRIRATKAAQKQNQGDI